MMDTRSGRRAILAAFVGAALSGSLLSASPALASGEWRYTEAVRLAHDVLRLADAHRTPGKRWSTPAPEVNGAVDRLLTHLLTEFPGVPASGDARAILVASGDLGALDETRLSRMVDSLVPVAILREIVRTHGVGFNASTCPGYGAFATRYASALLG